MHQKEKDRHKNRLCKRAFTTMRLFYTDYYNFTRPMANICSYKINYIHYTLVLRLESLIALEN